MGGKPTVIVGWITSGVIRAEFVRSLLQLQVYKLENWYLGGVMDQISPYIEENRNMLVKEMLDGMRIDWLLMIDIDMSFNPVAVDRLHEFVEKGETIVAGIYHQWSEAAGKVPLSCMENPETKLYRFVKLEKPEYVDGGPAGFMLLNRKPLEAMRVVYGDNWFTRLPTPDGRYYGEDLSFCRRAKEQGYRILGVPNLEIRHMKAVPL